MKFCDSCGKTYPDTAIYCATCGNQLVDALRCMYCNTKIEIGYQYCPKCGITLAKLSYTAPRPPHELYIRTFVRQRRYELLRTYLEELLNLGKDGFVIFKEQASGMFVQFVKDGDILRLDHPKPHTSAILTREHADKMKAILEQEKLEILEGEDSIAADVGNNVNFIIYLIETIFTQVFGFEDPYDLTGDLSLDSDTLNLEN